MCSVRVECLTYALEHNETWGLWGSTSDVERRQLRKLKARGGGTVQMFTETVTEKTHV
jgi:hypothetical protein